MLDDKESRCLLKLTVLTRCTHLHYRLLLVTNIAMGLIKLTQLKQRTIAQKHLHFA